MGQRWVPHPIRRLCRPAPLSFAARRHPGGGPFARLWLNQHAFTVGNVGMILTYPRLWVGAGLGVSWRFF
jgi:hypothetical protein